MILKNKYPGRPIVSVSELWDCFVITIEAEGCHRNHYIEKGSMFEAILRPGRAEDGAEGY